MDNWYEKRKEAIETYHANMPEQALQIFEQLLQDPISLEQEADIELWKANCYRSLRQFDQALKILEELEADDFILSPSTQDRLQHIKADIAVDLNDFEKALLIYQELLQSTKSYDDLLYLEMRIDDVLSDFESFKQHGTVDDWKEKIQRKLEKALTFFAKSE